MANPIDMCPDWNSNPQPAVYRRMLQPRHPARVPLLCLHCPVLPHHVPRALRLLIIVVINSLPYIPTFLPYLVYTCSVSSNYVVCLLPCPVTCSGWWDVVSWVNELQQIPRSDVVVLWGQGPLYRPVTRTECFSELLPLDWASQMLLSPHSPLGGTELLEPAGVGHFLSLP